MSILFSCFKQPLTDQIREKINNKINEIQDCCDWSQFAIDRISDKFNICKIKYENVLQEKDIWQDIAKLSVNLWNDYEYYNQFTFKGRHESTEYREMLLNIGLECNGGVWQSGRRPNLEDVQMNVFIYCQYRSICDEMRVDEEERLNSENEQRLANRSTDDVIETIGALHDTATIQIENVVEDIKCPFCDHLNSGVDVKCTVCEGELSFTTEPGVVASSNDKQPSDVGIDIRRATPVETDIRAIVGRKTPVSSINENSAKWVCRECTYINCAMDIICATCLSNQKAEDYSARLSRTFHSVAPRSHSDPITDNISHNVNCRTDPKARTYDQTAGSSQPPNVVQNKQTRGFNTTHWTCPSCSKDNKRDKRCCGQCFTFRDVDLLDDAATGPGPRWPCICGYNNLYETYLCRSCRKFAPFFRKWICEKCSFFNDELNRKCQICLNRNHLNKCARCGKMQYTLTRGLCSLCEKTSDDGKKHPKRRNSGVDISPVARVYSSTIPGRRRNCDLCLVILGNLEESVCGRCWDRKYFCNNRFCGAIYDKDKKHCNVCQLQRGSNVTEYNTVDVFNGDSYVKMWLCSSCRKFNGSNVCDSCKTQRKKKPPENKDSRDVSCKIFRDSFM